MEICRMGSEFRNKTKEYGAKIKIAVRFLSFRILKITHCAIYPTSFRILHRESLRYLSPKDQISVNPTCSDLEKAFFPYLRSIK